ncbi:MAG: VOC family protein, partial [Thermomicrobium sp.]|nr:VOC family protein [Thermomicrobium sp.]
YDRARARGCLDSDTFSHFLVELPNGNVQLYVRDPAGNLIEVDWPSVEALPPDLRAQCVRLEDRHPQSDWNRRATLFLESTTITR